MTYYARVLFGRRGGLRTGSGSIGSIDGVVPDHFFLSLGAWMFIFFNKCTYVFNTHVHMYNRISKIK